MIDIILVKNIFDDHPKTEVQTKDYIAGMTLAGYADMRDKDAYVGGMWVRDPKTFYVKDGMQLLILPHVAGGGFKKILGTVLMVGLMIAAPAMFVGWSSLALRALASGAVMILGGKIINSIFHLNQAASRGVDDQSSPTYGWELPNVQTQEGGVIGETFGECIPAPQLLMYHVETTNSDDQDKNNQYLNVLYSGGYGPVESIDDIRIGHTPIENFSDVQIETRKGTNNQSPIPFFGSTVADQYVDMTLAENKPVVRSTDMENCNRIDVTVSWPSGLYHMNDDGNYEGCTARFRIEYRKTGTSDWRGGNMYEAHSSSSLISNVTAGAKADRDEVWTIDRQDTTTRVKVRNHYRTETTWKWVIRSNKRSEVFDLPALNKGDRYDNGYIAFTRERVFSFRDGFSLDGVQIYVQKCDYYITKATNSGVRRSYAIKGLEPARYDVRVTALSLPHTSRDCSFMQWNTLSSFADDSAYSRPNKVLVALRIKATNQLNGGVPDINWRQRRTIGYVWNPETQAYEQVDLRNPVWAAYDILHHCRKLFNVNTQTEEYHVDGCPKERFTQYWDQWQAAADYADEDVKNADGSTEPRFRFDAYYDTSLRRYEAANKALAVAHATLVRHGLQLGVVVDKPGVIHQVFGEGRTLISSVKGEFSATEDRAHSLQVTYNDTQNDFKNTEFFIRSDAYASSEANGQDNTAQLSLFGVSSRTQAYREAVYALATNERQLQTIQFSADVNAFVCEYGDLIGVNSQVPRIGVASGRIVLVSGTTVKLDKTVTFTKGEAYTIMFQLSTNDALISREVTAFTADTTTDTITVTAAFDDGAVPAALDNYVLGLKDKAAKPFRITKIERDGEQRVSITAVEYDDAVFELDYSKYPKIDYATPPQLTVPTNLALVEQVYKNYAGVKTSRIYASWDVPKSAKYDDFHVYYSWDGENWTRVNTVFGTCATIENVTPPLTYHVKVCSVLDGIESKPVAATVQCTGHVEPAVTPTDLTAIEKYAFLSDGTPLYSITITWQPDKLTGQVYYKRTGTQAQNAVLKDGVAAEKTGYSSDWTFAGAGANQLTISPAIAGEYYKIAVCTADELGLYTDADSAPYTEIYVEPKKLIPNTPDNVSLIFDEASHISWDSVTNCDIKYYEIRTDTNAGADDAGLLARTNRLSTTIPLKSRAGTVCVFACSMDHKYSRPAVLQYNKNIPAAPTIDAQAGIGNLRLQVGAIPAGCLGVDYYINDQLEKTKNTTINHAVKTAGIYDVAAAYYDLFGEGEKSITLHVYVTDKVDQQFLADNAVALKNVDQDIKTAVNNANMAIPRITSLDSEVNGIVNNLNLDPGSSVYKSISDLNKSETELSSTFATMKASQDKVNTSVDTQISQIKQDATSLSSTVQSNKTAQDKVNTSVDTQISQIKQDTATIQTTVIDNKKAQDAKNTSFVSQITQNANSISSVVTDLSATQKDLADTKTKVDSNYTAIVQSQNDIAMRVKTGELIQQINLSKEGVAINGSKVHITGDTIFDNGVIVSSYLGDKQVIGTKIADGAISTAKLSANSVTSNELASNSVTTEKIEAGAITTDRIAAGAVTADSIGVGAITADKLTSGAVTADKLAANEINMAGALKIVGGAVTLDENGMTVEELRGGSVQFNESGMIFLDSNGNPFSGVGRFCAGTAKDGQTVRFNHPWDVIPTVFAFPISLQTSITGYTNANLYQYISAENVSTSGFDIACRTILKSGSNDAHNEGSLVNPGKFDIPKGGITKTVTWSASIPEAASVFNIDGSLLAGGYKTKPQSLQYSGSGGSTLNGESYEVYGDLEVLLDNQSILKKSNYSYYSYESGSAYAATGLPTGVNVEGKSNIKFVATLRYIFYIVDYGSEKKTNVNSSSGDATWSSYSGLKINSYGFNVNSDKTICQGTAGFIAIDPNTVPYSVS
jgi:hypothetical protein